MDEPPVEVVWAKMTVRLDPYRIVVFYEDGAGTLIAHQFHVYGEA